MLNGILYSLLYIQPNLYGAFKGLRIHYKDGQHLWIMYYFGVNAFKEIVFNQKAFNFYRLNLDPRRTCVWSPYIQFL